MNHRFPVGLITLLIISSLLVPAQSLSLERCLHLYNTHTRERIDLVYWRDNAYIADSLIRLDRFLRDRFTGDVHHYDPQVFDVLFELAAASDRPNGVINVICGYRSPQTNEYLRTHTSGVAKRSLHMEAEAIDIRLPGVKTAYLRDAAIALRRGGVGYYPVSDFIHVDVGRVRGW